MPEQKRNFGIFTPKECSNIEKCSIKEAETSVLKNREQYGNILMDIYKKKSTFKKHQKYLQFNKIIPLKSNNLNTLLGGGIYPGRFYLLYGKFATGKSQICHNICVSLYNEYKTLKTNVQTFFIDTEDTFRPERILEIAKGYNFNKEQMNEILKRVVLVKAQSTEMIIVLLNKIDEEGLEKNIKMIIIDSLTKFIRLELADKKISTIQVRDNLKKILQLLTDIKNRYNIPIIVTSQVIGLMGNILGFNVKPVQEFLLNEYVEEVVLLSKTDDEKNYAFLVNSCFSPEDNVEFKIDSTGIIDPK